MIFEARPQKTLLFGQTFVTIDERGDFNFGFDPEDGYTGYVLSAALTEPLSATHRVTSLAGHIYSQPNLKSAILMELSFGARVALNEEAEGAWLKVLSPGGWVALQHVDEISQPTLDWVVGAETFLGVPYLWGGNSSSGVDCSGLVQLAMYAAGRDCPRDSDLQEAAFPEAQGDLRRGDLVFWKGHVGILVDEETLLHANAHHMAVAKEPLAEAIERIGKKEFGAVTKYARP
ncbi:MAG: NlpC/P60 family protein [Pseudomonadota bacterium]